MTINNTSTESTPPVKTNPLETFLDKSEIAKHRIALFEKIHKENADALRAKAAPIKISVLQKGESEGPQQFEGISGETTPHEIAKRLKGDSDIAKLAVISKVNGELFDLHRPLEEDSEINFLEFGSKEGTNVFWHSSAHALGECLEILYGGKLTIGPALETSFYYDADLGEKKISEKDYNEIEKVLKKVVSSRQRFERVVLTKPQAIEMFHHNPFKLQIIKDNIADDAVCTAYRCGPLIDLCRGPHLPSTGLIKAFKILKHSGCYWKGNSSNPQLQRVYGVSYPDKKQLKDRLIQIKLAKERDHRKIGIAQNLFFFNNLSPGSCFWMPKGAIIYNKLVALMRYEYRKRGYEEVISPNIYNMKLWETSGHAAKYKDNMFCFELEKQEFAMKSMNCPGHCLMFKQKSVSYRDLPIRFADFGVLHRNELTGALSGLSRVRRFQQDDAHIFCSIDMIQKEIKDCLGFMKNIYGIFGFKFSLVLSTRPEKYIGEIAVWDTAEKALEGSLNDFGFEWSLNPADGAFYGPKIDVLLHDALGRSIQCATIQLDFNLPSKHRFDLKYTSKDNTEETPVIIHRAILGSVERFTSILAEHVGGKWPFWISPRQVAVVPLSEKHLEFSKKLTEELRSMGFEADCNTSNNKVQKKVRNSEIAQYNIILVVGKKEEETNEYVIRFRGKKELEKKSKDEMFGMFKQFVKSRTPEF